MKVGEKVNKESCFKIAIEKDTDSEYTASIEGADLAELLALLFVGVKSVSKLSKKLGKELTVKEIVGVLLRAHNDESCTELK